MKNLRQTIRQNAIFYLVAVLLALAVKQHYSGARPEDLHWILKPTAGLVSLISGESFVYEAGAGYVCPARKVIIAPACAGVNFMLMAFGMAVFAGLHHMRGKWFCFAWLVFGLLAAYLLTLAVNALRITVSIHTFASGLFFGGVRWEQIHRMEGVVIYFFFQYLFYSMIQKGFQRCATNKTGGKPANCPVLAGGRFHLRETVAKGMMPCCWYLSVTLAVPFFNGAAGRYGNLFYEHAVMVLDLCLITWLGIVVVELCGQGIRLFFTGGFQKA